MVRKTTIKNIDADNTVIEELKATLALRKAQLAEMFAARSAYAALPLAA